MGQPFLALITPLTGGEPGVPTHPIAPGGPPLGIWGPTDPRPTHPIAPGGLPPYPDQGLPPHVSLPIVLPPIEEPPPGTPSHPIVIPPGTPGYPSHPIYRPDVKPEHPIVIPPAPPEGAKPPPPEGGWGYHPDYGWGYFPMQSGPTPK